MKNSKRYKRTKKEKEVKKTMIKFLVHTIRVDFTVEDVRFSTSQRDDLLFYQQRAIDVEYRHDIVCRFET
jgi:hypothetical protein